MNLLILGDSYADDRVGCGSTRSWVAQLEQDHKITRRATAGSNLYWSWLLHQELAKDYDRVIWTVTQPGRLMMTPMARQLIFGSNDNVDSWWGLPNVNTIDSNLKQEIYSSPIAQTILWAARNYLTFLQDDQEQRTWHMTMLDLAARAETLFIPSFDGSCGTLVQGSLNDLSIQEPDHGKIPDPRCCHLCQENHDLVYLAVERWLKGGQFYLDPAAQL